MEDISIGANHSSTDVRTFQHPTMAMPLPASGGYVYVSSDIEHQHRVGICTAISLVQNAQKVFGKKYSADFNYLLQKKFFDNNWDEGSSIFNALKAGKTYGFLPRELFPLGEIDRTDYASYIAKLQAIPDSEITRLIALCSDKVTAYAQVDISTLESVQRAILDSEAGILSRYEVGNEWFTPSWLPQDINPLKPPAAVIGGHAIIDASFSTNLIRKANTWGDTWDLVGCGDSDFTNYRMTEAWIPYYNFVPAPVIVQLHPTFTIDLKFGSVGSDVTKLQKFLVMRGLLTTGVFGFFGLKTLAAVKQFQISQNIPVTGYVGPITRAVLNKLYK